MFSRLVRVMSLFILIVAAAFWAIPHSRAATIDSLTVQCTYTTASGQVEVSAPEVRIQIVLASNLTTVLATGVFPVDSGGSYAAKLEYPTQVEGTLLVIAIGEWDGQKYVRPATMTSAPCAGGGLIPMPTATPTAVLPEPTPEITATLPEIIGPAWNVTARMLEDTCGVKTPPTFLVSLTYMEKGEITVFTANKSYVLHPSSIHTSYIGHTSDGSATSALVLLFTSPTTFTAYEYTTYVPLSGCHWMLEWSGVLSQ